MPASKTRGDLFAKNLALYEKLLATIPSIQRKGATNPYTSLNGHMFTHLSPDGVLAIRLPKDELDAFLKKYKTTLSVSYGVVKKDWAVVPNEVLSKTKELQKYLEISLRYARSLKPKK